MAIYRSSDKKRFLNQVVGIEMQSPSTVVIPNGLSDQMVACIGVKLLSDHSVVTVDLLVAWHLLLGLVINKGGSSESFILYSARHNSHRVYSSLEGLSHS